MRIALNGRTISKQTREEMLDEFSLRDLANDLALKGFILQPVRAPRPTKRPHVRFLFVWKRPSLHGQVDIVRIAEWVGTR